MSKKRVLMVALDYPPCKSAGVQRTVKFIEFLTGLGWECAVLTGMPHMYEEISDMPVPSVRRVYRAFGLNTFKHLSVRGKHFSFSVKPDRFFTWYWHGVIVGKKALDEFKPDLIWSTFPCSTAHKIANKLSEKSGLPWVADYRDPFAGVNPEVNVTNEPGKRIDNLTIEKASKVVFSTKNCLDIYREYYSDCDEGKFSVITNGYNEEQFSEVEKNIKPGANHEGFTLLHSGALYPGGRDPRELIYAVFELKKRNVVNSDFRLLFRGCKREYELQELIEKLDLQASVCFLESIPYDESIEEMLTVDGLFLLQGKMFNNQIPGKAYEYLRSGKPILALVHKEGSTADLMSPFDGVYVADMNSKDEIVEQLSKMLIEHPKCIDRDIGQYSRESTAKKLAHVFDSLR